MILKPFEHDPTIFNIKSPEFYINMKPTSIPPRGHRDRQAFVDLENKKCTDGLTVNGIYIPGSFYYDFNFHVIELDDNGRSYGTAKVRDNGWIIHNDFYQAQQNKLHYCVSGSRQLGKSDVLVSLTMHEVSVYDNTTGILLFTSSKDQTTFTNKMKVAHDNLVDFLKVPLLDKDFNKDVLRFGYKETNNDNELHARLYLYNTAGGHNTEVGAGTTVTFFAFDEIAKAIQVDQTVIKESGSCRIGDIIVGDKIFGQDGKLTEVLGVYPYSNIDTYKLTLTDNREVVASYNHLWEVYDQVSKKEKILTTLELKDLDRYTQIDKRYNKVVKKNRFLIKKNEVLTYKSQDVLIDPYYLGIWLGDGDSSDIKRICKPDQEIKDYVEQYAKKLGLDYIFKYNKTSSMLTKKRGGYYCSDITKWADFYSLRKNKHIPECYLYNSYENRLELLKGLMDTDGTILKNGHMSFTNTNYTLIKDMEKLVRSLGISCSLTKAKKSSYKLNNKEFICKDSYQLNLFTDINLFKIKRKADRAIIKKVRGNSFINYTSIKSIDYIGKDETVCLSVDNKNKLFLVNDFIVTHNSPFRKAFNAVLPAFRGKDGFRNAAFTCFTGGNAEKSVDAEKFFMNPASSEILNVGGTGRFLDGTYRADFKKTTSFAEYLRHTTGQEIPTNSELETIECFYSDFDAANQLLDQKEENLLKAGDTEAYYNEKIYYPRKISDMFLKENSNPFSHLSSELERLYEYLETQDYHTQTYQFDQTGESLELRPVSQHYDPFSTNLDQPLVIIDKPRDLGKGKLYVLGLDAFNMDKTGTSPSRGSFYIMRKNTTDYKDPYQDTMVGWYNGRKDINHFRQLVFNVLKYFGADQGSASLLHEAADDSLTQWFMDKKKGYYLEDTYALSKQIFSNTKAVAAKGLRPTPRNQTYGLDRLLEYLEEEMPDGRKGLWRIKDKLLVKQLLRFSGSLGDCDAMVAFFHTLIHLYKEKNYIIKVNSAENKDTEKVEKIIADYNAFGFQLKLSKPVMKRSII